MEENNAKASTPAQGSEPVSHSAAHSTSPEGQEEEDKKMAKEARKMGNSNACFYWLGAPLGHVQRDLYLTALQNRFKVDEKNPPETSKDGVDYIYRAYDRVINKARGLLTFDGLLLTAFGLLYRNLQSSSNNSGLLLSIGSVLPLVASLPLLVIFWMNWGASNDYQSNENDLKSMVTATCKRTWLLALSIYITVADMVILSIGVFKSYSS